MLETQEQNYETFVYPEVSTQNRTHSFPHCSHHLHKRKESFGSLRKECPLKTSAVSLVTSWIIGSKWKRTIVHDLTLASFGTNQWPWTRKWCSKTIWLVHHSLLTLWCKPTTGCLLFLPELLPNPWFWSRLIYTPNLKSVSEEWLLPSMLNFFL